LTKMSPKISQKKKQPASAQSKYRLSKDGAFTIEAYDQVKPFSNFFPGVAGTWGIPMWVFYVNRGQCIASFGIEGKDKAMVEFRPANKAYRLTSTQGFRTFLKVKKGTKTTFWEPFAKENKTRKMSMSSHDLTIEEVNKELGLKVTVNYFTVPQEDFPALVRRVKVENLSRAKLQLEMIDGLPMIMPYGMNDWVIKNMSRTVEAWVKVRNVKERAPYYQLNVEVSDTPDVRHITEGNFYFSFEAGKKNGKLLEPAVDPQWVFGPATDFLSPQRFCRAKTFSLPAKQQTSNRTPSAMGFSRFSLAAGKEKEIVSLVGHARSQKQLNNIVRKAVKPGFIASKALQNRDVIDEIKNYALTSSASDVFDQYSGQTFLDNVLRGGLPISFKASEGKIAFNVFSRKHGDLERDYNYFMLSPTHFSQGNGNYRDVNQNRRNDAWFNPDVKENNIINFLSLVQADGYNPLVVKGLSFFVQNAKKVDKVIESCVKGKAVILKERLQTEFQPGELLEFMAKNEIHLKVTEQKFLGQLLGACRKHEVADHVEGYWSDHWTYNLDLIESYLSLYPEELQTLLLKKRSFFFYHSEHYILPRDQRYILTENGVRQYHSVKDGFKHIPAEKNGHKLRTRNGDGDVYYTTLITKLLCLIANKVSTFDPSGIGIEMEGGRPNWYDALNGLPGLMGSSINESIELKRFCVFLSGAIERLALEDKDSVLVYRELVEFIRQLTKLMVTKKDPNALWHEVNDVKERYRARIQNGIEGEEQTLTFAQIQEFLTLVIKRVDRAIVHAKDKDGCLSTYFSHDAVDFALLDRKEDNMSYVLPVKFKRHALPLFLEGFVHALRVVKNTDAARVIHQAVRKSPIFDKKLRMYKNNADLKSESEEIGRTRIFPSGWLENGSVWLHMEYKYLLELLRCGLHQEFFEMFQDVLVPFQDPERYGRSILENSSFLVSSSHEDESLHGQGFVARLSGSTAEFVHIWLIMNAGQSPFSLDDLGHLNLSFRPVLPEWMFTKKEQTVTRSCPVLGKTEVTLPANTYAFHFLGSTLVVYHNPKRKDTFGPLGCSVKKYRLQYRERKTPVDVEEIMIPGTLARDVRDLKIERIDVFLD